MTDNDGTYKGEPYKPGDIVNGYILGTDGEWHSSGPLPPSSFPPAFSNPVPKTGPAFQLVEPPPKKSPLVPIVAIIAGLIALLVVVGAVMSMSDASDDPVTRPTPTEVAPPTTEPEPEPTTFQEWVLSEGTGYLRVADDITKVGNAGSRAADTADLQGVADACGDFGDIGLEGLALPDSPDSQFNRAWDTAMSAYVEAGTYAADIRDGDYVAMAGCANSIEKATAATSRATAILGQYS